MPTRATTKSERNVSRPLTLKTQLSLYGARVPGINLARDCICPFDVLQAQKPFRIGIWVRSGALPDPWAKNENVAFATQNASLQFRQDWCPKWLSDALKR